MLDCSNAGQDNISYMIYSSVMVKLDLDEFSILKSHGEMGAGHIDEDLIFLMRILVLGFVALPVLCSTLRKGYGVRVLYSSNLYKQALLRMSAVWFVCAIFGALDIYRYANVRAYLGRDSLLYSAVISLLLVCGVSWKKRSRVQHRRLQYLRELNDHVEARNIALPDFIMRVNAVQRHTDELLGVVEE